MKKKLVAIAAAAVALIPLTGSPATAGVGGGKIVFECVADLPQFPSGGASGQCGDGTLADETPTIEATASGKITGRTDDEQPFVLVAAAADFEADFDYQEACVAGEPPAAGTASGEATVSGWTGFVGTTAVEADVTVTFDWTRVGTTAAITISGGDIEFTSPENFEDDVTGVVLGAGQASFAPVLTAGTTCPTGGPLKAMVAGSAAVTVRGI